LVLVERAKGGDQAAAMKLLSMHWGLALIKVRRYLHKGLDREDVYQHIRLGFLKGLAKFEAELGFRVPTYVMHWVHDEVRSAVRSASALIRVSNGAHARTFRELRDGATSEETRRIVHLLRPISLDAPVHGEEGEALIDTLASGEPPMDEPVEEENHGAAQRALLDRALASLPARSAEIVRRRFLAETPESLQQIGDDPRIGLTRERVRQLEGRALRSIRTFFARHASATELSLLELKARGATLDGPRVSRFRGLTWEPRRGMWLVRVQTRHRLITVGTFADEDEAARAYDVEASKRLGAKAKLNFPGVATRDAG